MFKQVERMTIAREANDVGVEKRYRRVVSLNSGEVGMFQLMLAVKYRSLRNNFKNN